jgi:DNA polymerase-3 subunit epsilon
MAYLELRGGRERKLDLGSDSDVARIGQATYTPRMPRPVPLGALVTAEELAAHAAFVAELGDAAVWKKFG